MTSSSAVAQTAGTGAAPGATAPAPAKGRATAPRAKPRGTGTAVPTLPPTVGNPVAPYTPPNVPPNAPTTAPGSAAQSAAGAPPAQGATIGTAITQGTTGPAGARVLTLGEAVALAINSNSNVTLARQRLQVAQEQIVQVDAEGRPQISASVIDTYSSVSTFGTSGVAVLNPSLPGGGVIPTVTDEGGGSTASFTGGGGGGTASSNGAVSTTSATGTTTGATTTPTTTGATTGTGGAGAGGTGTGGTIGSGTTGQARLGAMPTIIQQFASATKAGAQIGPGGTRTQAQPAATTVTNPTTGTTVGSISSGQRNNYSGRLTATQYIDLFGLLPAAKAVQVITRDFYLLDLARIQNETALTAKNYFFDVLRDQEIINVDQEQVDDATENVRITQAAYAAGTAARFDVLTAQVTLVNDQQAVLAARNQLSLDQANLNNLLSINPNTPITLQAPPLPPLDQAIDLSRGTQIAFQQRPELRQADYDIAIARKLVKLAGATLEPSLGVGGTANYEGTSSPDEPQSTFNLSAELDIPLYDGGTTRSKVRQARIDLQTQTTTRDQLRLNVSVEVRQAYLSVTNAQEEASTAGVGVSQAEEAVRLAQVQYQNGISTFLNVINAQAQLATARNNLATAQYNYQTALAQLVRAEGGR